MYGLLHVHGHCGGEETVTEMPSVGSFSPRVVLRHRLGLDFGFLIACSCWLRQRSSEFNRNLPIS